MTHPFFPHVEPPSGGLARLRRKLDGHSRARSPLAWVLPMGAIAVAVTLLFWPPSSERPVGLEPSTEAYALGLMSAPADQVVLSSSAPMQPLTAPSSKVRVFAVLGEVTAAE